MNTRATVLWTDGKTATVKAYKQSACSGCKGCGDGKENCHAEFMISELPDSYELNVKNDLSAKAGDIVEICNDSKISLFLALITFIAPVCTAIIAYMIEVAVTDGFIPVIATGVAFILMFFTFAFVANRLSAKFTETSICKIIKENGERQP